MLNSYPACMASRTHFVVTRTFRPPLHVFVRYPDPKLAERAHVPALFSDASILKARRGI